MRSDESVFYYSCDITSTSAVRDVALRIRHDVGDPTILINNAGMGSYHTILDTTEEDLEKIFKVNLLSHWAMIKEFLPSMIENKKGHIIGVASLASYTVVPGIVDYGATKVGVLALYEGKTPSVALVTMYTAWSPA
jgi:all-trans-retinol dehydrogenase (NAD+)